MSRHQDYVQRASFEIHNPHAKQLLLLLHGLGGDRNQPLRLINGWQRDDLTILAPDLRAHGQTDQLGDADSYRLDSMADDVLALLNHLQQLHKPTYIAGISMGAAIALRIALRTPPNLRGLAFIRPAFSDTPYPTNLEPLIRIAPLLPLGAEGRSRYLQSDTYQLVAAASPSGAASLIDQFDKPAAAERADRLRLIPGHTAWTTTAELQGLTAPTIVLGADRDPVHPITLARRWAGFLPNAIFHQVPARDEDPDSFEHETQRLVRDHVVQTLQLDRLETRIDTVITNQPSPHLDS